MIDNVIDSSDDNVHAIQVSKTSFWYTSGKIILDAVSLASAENEFTAILGQNGCGKTTLLKNICGLLRPSQGQIFLRGKDTKTMGVADIAGEIGFVMQEGDRQLFEQTVYDEVAFALKYANLPKNVVTEKVEQSLDALGLQDKREAFPLALNRADRIKTVFAAVLAMGPSILLLDEPVAGQDKRGCYMIMDIIAQLHQRGYTILMITHNIDIAAEYAKRIVVMKNAVIHMDGCPRNILGNAESLAEAGILPPHITRLSQSLRKHLPLEQDALTPRELATMLVQKNKQ
jgi:energy-coupling factor transport system ATP-binding protein